VALAEWEVLDAQVVRAESVVLEALEVPVVRVESAEATSQRSGNTTRSTVAERLMEIEAPQTGSAARLEAISGIVKPEQVRI
jgi:hypothetical protein